jgi:competence protein ComEC
LPGFLPAECWFMDVGQGLSTIALLGEGRAIVIDAGPAGSSVPLELLKRYAQTIELLVLSHNHKDHDGGAARIIEAYPRAINRILFLVSESPAELKSTWRVLLREQKEGNLLNEPERLELPSSGRVVPRKIYTDTHSGIELHLLYPTFMENLNAGMAASDRANATSAIIALMCAGRKIILSGDANMLAWDALAGRLGSNAPMRCEVVTVPHHGGNIAHGAEPIGEALERLYSHIIIPKHAIISVGSSNMHGHPLAEVVRVLSSHNISVLCTQMTPQCSPDLEAVRPGVLVPAYPSQSSGVSKKTGAGRSRDVACAGSVVAEIGPSAIRITRLGEHAAARAAKVACGQCDPLCDQA